MTNKELQEVLRQYPDDAEVFLSGMDDYGVNAIAKELDESRISYYQNEYHKEIEFDAT